MIQLYNNNINNIQNITEKDAQLLDLQDCRMEMFSCRPILFYVIYVTFIHDKLYLNAVYITHNTVR